MFFPGATLSHAYGHPSGEDSLLQTMSSCGTFDIVTVSRHEGLKEDVDTTPHPPGECSGTGVDMRTGWGGATGPGRLYVPVPCHPD